MVFLLYNFIFFCLTALLLFSFCCVTHLYVLLSIHHFSHLYFSKRFLQHNNNLHGRNRTGLMLFFCKRSFLFVIDDRYATILFIEEQSVQECDATKFQGITNDRLIRILKNTLLITIYLDASEHCRAIQHKHFIRINFRNMHRTLIFYAAKHSGYFNL
jgi:hypothetical protein